MESIKKKVDQYYQLTLNKDRNNIFKTYTYNKFPVSSHSLQKKALLVSATEGNYDTATGEECPID